MRHGRSQSRVVCDQPAMSSLVDDADAQEQGYRGNTVVHHLEHGALDPLLIEHEESERHESHVADAGVGDQLLDSSHLAMAEIDLKMNKDLLSHEALTTTLRCTHLLRLTT